MTIVAFDGKIIATDTMAICTATNAVSKICKLKILTKKCTYTDPNNKMVYDVLLMAMVGEDLECISILDMLEDFPAFGNKLDVIVDKGQYTVGKVAPQSNPIFVLKNQATGDLKLLSVCWELRYDKRGDTAYSYVRCLSYLCAPVGDIKIITAGSGERVYGVVSSIIKNDHMTAIDACVHASILRHDTCGGDIEYIDLTADSLEIKTYDRSNDPLFFPGLQQLVNSINEGVGKVLNPDGKGNLSIANTLKIEGGGVVASRVRSMELLFEKALGVLRTMEKSGTKSKYCDEVGYYTVSEIAENMEGVTTGQLGTLFSSRRKKTEFQPILAYKRLPLIEARKGGAWGYKAL